MLFCRRLSAEGTNKKSRNLSGKLQLKGIAAHLNGQDRFTSLRWHNPDQVQRVILAEISVRTTPLVKDIALGTFPFKSRIIDAKLKKSDTLKL